LLAICGNTQSFTVYSRLGLQKRKIFVPGLSHVKVSNGIAFIFTRYSKIIQLDMSTGEEIIISDGAVKSILGTNRIYGPDQIEKRLADKTLP